MHPNDITPQEQTDIATGLKAANTFLKNTTTTVDKDGVLVKVNGEGFILDLQISKQANEGKLAEVIMNNLNEAVRQNKAKILENALQDLPKARPVY